MTRLTEQQRSQWAIDGYLHLKKVLSPDEIELFVREVDRMRQQPGWEPSPDGPLGHYSWLDHSRNVDPTGFMDRRDLLPYHSAFIDLMDRPEVFDLIVDIMGPYILLSMTQAIVRSSNEKFKNLHREWQKSHSARLLMIPIGQSLRNRLRLRRSPDRSTAPRRPHPPFGQSRRPPPRGPRPHRLRSPLPRSPIPHPPRHRPADFAGPVSGASIAPNSVAPSSSPRCWTSR